MGLPEPVRRWRDDGTTLAVSGREIFLHDTGQGVATPILIVHGFPGSSYDFAGVIDVLSRDRRVIAFDLPGYGLSSKDPQADYSLFKQADVVERVLAELGIGRCVIVAHDTGDTVTAELLSRANAGALGFAVEQVVLTNGSIFIDQARLTRGQRLTLRLPDRALPIGLPELILRRSLLESFTPTAPPPPGAIDGLVALIQHNHGGRLMPRLIRYIEERRRNQEHWTAGLVDYAGQLSMIWGEQDPIAVLAMTERLVSLRPATSVVTLPECGHWPSIEAPDRLATEILGQLPPVQ